MSLARVHRAAKARKEWTCGKCKATIKVGEPVLSYSVGFRGREQRRCDKPSCRPTRAERESSLVSSVYDAIDSADWSGCSDLEEIQGTMAEVAQAFRDVAEEYESSEMYERNPDLQERAETLNNSAETLEVWEPSEEEPVEDDKETWGDHDPDATFEAVHEAWLDAVRDEAREAVDDVEVP